MQEAYVEPLDDMMTDSSTLKWLAYPYEFKTFRTTLQADNDEANMDEKISRFKILNIWLAGYEILQIRDCVEKRDTPKMFEEVRSSQFFFQYGKADGGWQFDGLLERDDAALENPISAHQELDFSRHPREKWNIISMEAKR